jgi:hypothetical protein
LSQQKVSKFNNDISDNLMPQSGKIKKKKKRKESADKLTKKSSSDEVHDNILTRQYYA